MYTSYGWELTNLLQGQDEEYLLEVLTENYRRLRDVPDHLIVTLLEYRGYTGRLIKVKIKIKKYDTRNYRTNAQRVIRY